MDRYYSDQRTSGGDTLFAVQSSDTLPVQSDFSAGYNLVGAVEAERQVNYVLLGRVESSRSSAYLIFGTVQADLVVTFSVIGSVQRDLTAEYEVLNDGQVVADFSAAYNLRSDVSSDVNVSYAVCSAVQSEVTQGYAIRAAVFADLVGEYAILSGGGSADPAAVWQYVLPNGKSAQQTLVELHAMLVDLYKIHGLMAGVPLVVDQTSRVAGDIEQAITEVSNVVTVTRTS